MKQIGWTQIIQWFAKNVLAAEIIHRVLTYSVGVKKNAPLLSYLMQRKYY